MGVCRECIPISVCHPNFVERPSHNNVQENLTCRQNIINSSANAPLNATKIAVKKGSDVDICMFGPEL